MKSLHLVYTFAPDPVGGTEVYVERLCRHLSALGEETVIVAPGTRDDRYEIDGQAVRRFGVDQAQIDLEAIYGEGSPEAAAAFDRILHEEAPDLVHQHALTAAVSTACADRAKAKGLPVVLTYHTPTVTCLRGTLLEFGRTVCDGHLSARRCAACSLEGHGVPEAMSHVLGMVPPWLGNVSRQWSGGGRPMTAVRMSALVQRRIDVLQRLFSCVDRVVVLTPWVEALLLSNCVPASKLVACPHGVDLVEPHGTSSAPARTAGSSVRIAHLGRLDPTKGTAFLVDALAAAPGLPVAVDIFGVIQTDVDRNAGERLKAAAARDPRVKLLPPIPQSSVIERLGDYDFVAVPSQWMETGPLVVLEAFAAGVPVLGSDLGGIADKVRHEVDGLLVSPYNSVAAWTNALTKVASDRETVTRLRRGVRPPRSSRTVAIEMQRLYAVLVAA